MPVSGKTETAARLSFFTQRRVEVDQAWAAYRLEVFSRDERGDSAPYKYGFDELHKQTDAFVRREASRWAYSCQNYRIYEDDFESYLRVCVWKAALRYTGAQGYFFDYLRASLKNMCKDMLRNARTKKNRVDHFAKSIEAPNVMKELNRRRTARSAEYCAVNQMVIAEMAEEQTLTKQERNLFNFLRGNPEATLQEMADAIEVRDRKQAARVKQRLANKLQKYI